MPRSRRPRRALGVGGEHLGDLGLGLEQRVPRRVEQVAGLLGRALGGRQVEEVLEHLVHEGAAHRVGRGLLGQLVDGAVAVEQRAGHEVAGPARRERPQHLDPVDGGGVVLGGRGRRGSALSWPRP